MSDRGVGLAFLAIGAFLYAARYVAAAIYMTGKSPWGAPVFDEALGYVGPELMLLGVVSAILGAVFFVRGEWARHKMGRE